jgi:hypothetical protein
MKKHNNFQVTILFLAPMLLLSSCSSERTEVSRLVSPGGATIATLVREAGGGGATVSAIYYLYLSPAISRKSDDHPILTATYCGPTLRWLDGRTLQVNYTSGCDIRRFNNLWFSESDIKSAQGPTVEIILNRSMDRSAAGG